MSALSESRIEGLPIKLEMLEAWVAPILWKWFNTHGELTVYQFKTKAFGVVPISFSLRVKDCRRLVEMLIGPESSTLPPTGTF